MSEGKLANKSNVSQEARSAGGMRGRISKILEESLQKMMGQNAAGTEGGRHRIASSIKVNVGESQ